MSRAHLVLLALLRRASSVSQHDRSQALRPLDRYSLSAAAIAVAAPSVEAGGSVIEAAAAVECIFATLSATPNFGFCGR